MAPWLHFLSRAHNNPVPPVLLHTGETIPFADLHREPVALVFLRHLGCLFCREHVAQLAAHPELNVVFVAMAGSGEVNAFREDYASPHRFVCDPERVLHAQYGIATARMGQVLSPRVLARSLAAWRYGVSRPTGDPMSLAATIVLNESGEVTWTHHSKDVADNATPEQIAKALG